MREYKIGLQVAQDMVDKGHPHPPKHCPSIWTRFVRGGNIAPKVGGAVIGEANN